MRSVLSEDNIAVNVVTDVGCVVLNTGLRIIGVVVSWTFGIILLAVAGAYGKA